MKRINIYPRLNLSNKIRPYINIISFDTENIDLDEIIENNEFRPFKIMIDGIELDTNKIYLNIKSGSIFIKKIHDILYENISNSKIKCFYLPKIIIDEISNEKELLNLYDNLVNISFPIEIIIDEISIEEKINDNIVIKSFKLS